MLKVRPFVVGKVPHDALKRAVYPYTGKRNIRLLVGPGIGKDIAAIKYHPVLVLTADPITGTSTRIGEHSVHVNANDIATAGASPMWYMCTILLSRGSNEKILAQIMNGIDRASRKLGIAVVRGHTEVTPGVDRPLIAGFMIGERKGRLLRAVDARPGDLVLMTKTAGIEGTAILASDHASRLHHVKSQSLLGARKFFNDLSIVREALTISKIRGVRVMHDPTEGGVINACWELAEASRLGIEIWGDRIPIAQETREICSELRMDPLRLMSSGCLLAIVGQSSISQVAAMLRKLRVQATVIGKMRTRGEGRRYSLNGKIFQLRPVPRDELYKLA